MVDDDFSERSLAGRQIRAGNWEIHDGIALATHDASLDRSSQKHGPKLFYDMAATNGAISIEMKPSQADSFVITLGEEGLTHVLRVRVNVDGHGDDSEPSSIMTFTEKEPGQRKAQTIPLLSEGMTNLRADQWNRIRILCLHRKAVVAINDEVWTVFHDRLDQFKPIAKIELQHGSIALRQVHVSTW
ncbi:MAG: family 16 glycoside hydrolase [Planctomycetota bacterium]